MVDHRGAKGTISFFAVIFLFAIIPAYAFADFYVIPVGGRSVNPSDVVELGTTSIGPGSYDNLSRISTAATNLGDFTVPDGKVLVISIVQIFPTNPTPGSLQVRLDQDTRARRYWVVPSDQPTQLLFPAGLIIAPGYTLEINNYAASASSIRVNAFGYITDDK
jgi:hypothetical protein